jgi:hypothetical protein
MVSGHVTCSLPVHSFCTVTPTYSSTSSTSSHSFRASTRYQTSGWATLRSPCVRLIVWFVYTDTDCVGRVRRKVCVRLRLKCDGTRAETRFRLSPKRTSPFKSAGASVQSTSGNRVVRISSSNAGYTTFRGSVKSTGYPLHSPVSPSLPLPASPCAIRFQTHSTLH